MDKQELINRLKNILTTPSEIEGYDFDFDDGYDFGIEHAISLAEDLDEPVVSLELEKPVVPQFLADWYEEHKDNFEEGVYDLFVKFYEDRRELDTELYQWFKLDGNKQTETLVKMKLFGYEIEKEKLYTVEIPNPDYPDKGKFVLCKNKSGKVFIKWTCLDDWEFLEEFQLTEAEIKQDFEWAFRWAKELEE